MKNHTIDYLHFKNTAISNLSQALNALRDAYRSGRAAGHTAASHKPAESAATLIKQAAKLLHQLPTLTWEQFDASKQPTLPPIDNRRPRADTSPAQKPSDP